MKSGNLNFLEPSGPLQACNGTALPFNNNKVENVCVTYYCGSFAWPLLQWKDNNMFYVYCYGTLHNKQYNNIQCCTILLLSPIYVADNKKTYFDIVVYYFVYKHNIYHKNDNVYLINYTTTCFGYTIAVLKPIQNNVQVHKVCARWDPISFTTMIHPFIQ